MIRIDRGTIASPAELTSAAKKCLPIIEARVKAGTLDSKCFDSSVYSSEAVRGELWEMQHHKCCFCEREYERKRSTVEHFRPKTEVDRGQGRVNPGYWWLAYEFGNLYFCYANCNTSKGCHFPLEAGSPILAHPAVPWPAPDPSQQSTPAKPELTLLIDPGYENPEVDLTFVELPGNGEWQIAPVNGSARGRETIRKIDLDRDDLNKLRAKHFKNNLRQIVEDFKEAKTQSNSLAEEQTRRRAEELTAAQQPFALLARVVFRKNGIL